MTKAKAILIACLVFIVGLSSAAPAQAVKLGPRPPWGACGVSTASSKVVYDYGFIQLQCGDANWGYRHIKDRHYTEFQVLAAPAGLNWSDLVQRRNSVAVDTATPAPRSGQFWSPDRPTT